MSPQDPQPGNRFVSFVRASEARRGEAAWARCRRGARARRGPVCAVPFRVGSVLGLSRGCPGVVPWLSRGCPVVVPWLSRGCPAGCPVVVPWLSRGCLALLSHFGDEI